MSARTATRTIKQLEARDAHLSVLFGAAETARTAAWLAGRRGEWTAVRVEAERAAGCYRELAELAAAEVALAGPAPVDETTAPVEPVEPVEPGEPTP